MTWDRDKWLEEFNAAHRHGAHGSEVPTPEKEHVALVALREAAEARPPRYKDGNPKMGELGALVPIHEVLNRAYHDHGVHLAHALWLADFLEARDVGVQPLSPNLFSVEDAGKLAAPFEDYEATD